MDIVHELVVDYLCEVRKLVVIDEHRVPLGYHLLDERPVYREGLTRTWSSEDHSGSERVHDIDPALSYPVLILKPERDIDRVLSLHLLGTLAEGLVPVVDGLIECAEFPARGCYCPSEYHRSHYRGNQVAERIHVRKEKQNRSEDSRTDYRCPAHTGSLSGLSDQSCSYQGHAEKLGTIGRDEDTACP